MHGLEPLAHIPSCSRLFFSSPCERLVSNVPISAEVGTLKPQLQQQISQVAVSEDVAGFIMDIVESTRHTGELVNGVSTRGAIALYKAAQVTAAMEGRDFVIPEDVVKEAVPVLAHRISAASGSRGDSEKYLMRKLSEVAVPLENLNTL